MRLSEKALAGLKLDEGRKDRLIFDAACPGLGVRLTAKGTRTFVAQWTDPATRRKVREPLGVWGSLTLDQAREAARARLGAVAKGIDVPAERQARKAADEAKRAEEALTFDTLVAEWAALHLAHRRPRYASEAVRAIRYSLADLLSRPAARITRKEAVDALDKLAEAGKTAMAGRVMAYARAAFRWAQKRGKVAANPFADLPVSGGATERDRVLTDAELGEVWAAADGMAYPFGPFVKLAILTLQRREEVAGMRWSEIATDLSQWTIPGARMKNGKPHDVHLSEPARDVLRAVTRIEGRDIVFSTTGTAPISGFSKAKDQLDAAVTEARVKAASTAGIEPVALVPWRLHDLRRTGVSMLAALGFDSIVADLLLAHQPGKLRGTARVYQRHSFAKERARALDAWAAHVAGVGDAGATVGNVVTLQRATK
jgi:integrase